MIRVNICVSLITIFALYAKGVYISRETNYLNWSPNIQPNRFCKNNGLFFSIYLKISLNIRKIYINYFLSLLIVRFFSQSRHKRPHPCLRLPRFIKWSEIFWSFMTYRPRVSSTKKVHQAFVEYCVSIDTHCLQLSNNIVSHVKSIAQASGANEIVWLLIAFSLMILAAQWAASSGVS